MNQCLPSAYKTPLSEIRMQASTRAITILDKSVPGTVLMPSSIIAAKYTDNGED